MLIVRIRRPVLHTTSVPIALASENPDLRDGLRHRPFLGECYSGAQSGRRCVKSRDGSETVTTKARRDFARVGGARATFVHSHTYRRWSSANCRPNRTRVGSHQAYLGRGCRFLCELPHTTRATSYAGTSQNRQCFHNAYAGHGDFQRNAGRAANSVIHLVRPNDRLDIEESRTSSCHKRQTGRLGRTEDLSPSVVFVRGHLRRRGGNWSRWSYFPVSLYILLGNASAVQRCDVCWSWTAHAGLNWTLFPTQLGHYPEQDSPVQRLRGAQGRSAICHRLLPNKCTKALGRKASFLDRVGKYLKTPYFLPW